jgi:methionyl-tRNA formyltransferase
MKRYLFIGSVEYSAFCLKVLLEMNVNIVGIMCPYREVAGFNSDYFDLGVIAREYGKEVYYFKKIADETAYIKEKRPDVIFVLGFSQIIPKQILGIPAIDCIGSHPALLPQNRGRHPIIWAIANGLTKSGITLFWIDDGVDSGDIWKQEVFEISLDDDATSIYEKVKQLSVEMLKDGIGELEQGVIRRIKQDNSLANCWRKRTKEDGKIDWRMSSKRIYDLVRALTRPYIGAHCVYKGKEYKIWKVKMINDDRRYQNLEPGKVIAANESNIRVKTGDGAVEIIQHNFERLPVIGEYL